MAKRQTRPKRIKADRPCGDAARAQGHTLTTHGVGALPMVNRILEEMKLEKFLTSYLPQEDGRTKVSTARTLMVLIKNVLLARDPIYGVGEWAAGYAPELLGLTPCQVTLLNDDRVGRCLVKLCQCDYASLTLAVATHVVKRFQVRLDELHNDSTTVTFHGAYDQEGVESRDPNASPLLITWGHNKDHRPDLKQLLYILTVARDGAVPVYFTAASGNVTDDTTHRDTWDLLCELAGRRDFLYVADCKLASAANLNYIHRNGGRFLTVLPRTRREDKEFRKRLLQGRIHWRTVKEEKNEAGELVDRVSIWEEPTVSHEGYPIYWYHSTRKVELDAAARATRVNRALTRLAEIEAKLQGPKPRIRTKAKALEAAVQILRHCRVEGLIRIEAQERRMEQYRQDRRGRPGKDTRYVKQVRTYCALQCQIDQEAIEREEAGDGVFPLITNLESLSAREVLEAYKKQPLIEKRFSQLKTDFRVAPVYLKSPLRIEALLCVYFFVLMTQALLERELRRAMERKGVKAIRLYPERRLCHRPTARRLIDLFENIQRHTLHTRGQAPVTMVTELSRVQRQVLRLLGLPATPYGR